MKGYRDGGVTGQAVDVYDGRKWPVVRCESVYVNPSDSAHKVTQAVLLIPSVHEKRRRASKYTVAVGTSHGHVQVFLKDSDLVLASLQKCPTDEKCLMLIKRPKDASRKLLKTQSLNNLSMSDSQLYRQYDGTAVNNPYMVHKVKGKIAGYSDKDNVATDIFNSQPPVRNSALLAASKPTKNIQALRPNTFVPIPELGIYTPDQHVLQNGTYAQHCHNREINNNNRKNQSGYQLDNISSVAASTNGNFSFNSSFDESVSSYGFQNKGVLPCFDGVCNGQTIYPTADVYHSCIDLPNSHRDIQNLSTLNTTKLCNPDHRSTKDVSLTNNHDSANTKPVQPTRDQDKSGNIKIDPSVRSHSLGDLTAGLTFSLVGQKKSESVVSVTDISKKEMLKNSNSSRNTEDGNARKIDQSSRGACEKFRGPGPGSQSGMAVKASSGNKSPKKLSGASASDANHYFHHLPKHHTRPEEPHQQSQQFQQPYQQQLLKQHSVPEGYSHSLQYVSSPEGYPQPIQPLPTPRTRKDSEDTTSSYKSALSDVRSPKDFASELHNHRKCVPTKPFNNSVNSSCMSNTSNSTSVHSTFSSLKDGRTPVKTHPTTISAQPSGNPNREQSPLKPRRSLPSVPLNETSERIKRFTELMKSRMSASSSSSRNCSVDSSSNKNTPSRMSSIGSACFQGEHSRKSSLETASDSEVFVMASDNHYDSTSERPQQSSFSTINETSSHMSPSQPLRTQVDHRQDGYNISKVPGSVTNSNKSSGYPNESNYGAKDAHIRYINRRKSYADYVGLQDSSRTGYYNMQKGSVDHGCHDNHEQNEYHSQYYGMVMSGETPLPPGDRSTDSGQTTIINHSFNGSALDSGYTTNNDGENDSCKSNPHRHHHQNQHQHPYLQHPQQQTQQQQIHHPEQQHPQQQFPPGQYMHQNPHNGFGKSSTRDGQTNSTEESFKYQMSNKQSNNLANSRRFGSVQNISSAQAHGNPKDFNILKNNKLFNGDKFSQSTPHNPSVNSNGNDSSRLPQDIVTNQRNYKGNIRSIALKNDVPPVNQILSQLQNQEIYRSANRRSWDYADVTFANKNDGIPANQMKRYARADDRYRSSEIMSASKGYYEGNYVNTNQAGSKDYNQQAHFKNQNWAMNSSSSQNVNSSNENGKLNSIKEFTPLMSHSYHGDLDSGRGVTHLQKSNNSVLQESGHLSGYHPGVVGSQQSTDFYRKSNGSYNQQQQEEVHPRPVPVSRTNRLARGHTLPGGFCFNESDPSSPQFPQPNQDITLFHLAQKYDLAPLLINLPQDKLLKDLVELSEVSVDMSVAEVPCLPSSPQGKMPQIGTPGSAFTPVKNSLEQKKPLTVRLKVICFSIMKDEIHNYTTLGRILKGDIVLEVNGWFCLGSDVDYLKKVVENCKGAITLTVARLKESDEKRYKGQTAAERIKGLESEISRLDDLILVRDHKIQNLTSANGSVNLKLHTGTLSDVNGRIPVEGMVIGSDEYVV